MRPHVVIRRTVSCLVYILGVSFALVRPPTYAYIDPGTGSFLVQAVIAGLLGILVSLKLYWARIKVIFKERLKFGSKALAKHE